MLAGSSYTLTSAIVAAHVGAGVMCLAEEGVGRRWKLHAQRPGAEMNLRARVNADGRVTWRRMRADLPSGANHVASKVAQPAPALIAVEISGPLEQRAGFYDQPSGCYGWSDGHDAVCERLCAAFGEGDVLLIVDSPGGSAAGLQEAVGKALRGKAANGRRVTVWVNEMMGSAATWWGMALGDEIFLPAAGQCGSIGARGDAMSIAGMMQREGIAKEYFCWPDKGKVALAPDLAEGITDDARQRVQRDVDIAGEAFCAAVLASPVAKAAGLTEDDVRALRADMLTGESAVAAGLATGVATEDEVIAYALRMAEEGGKDSGAQARASRKDRGMSLRAEENEKTKRADDDPPSSRDTESDRGAEPTGKCKSCGMQNEDDAKFCDQCGASMAAERKDEMRDETPSSMPPPPERMQRAALVEADFIGQIAQILGASSASKPAMLTAAYDHADVRARAAWATGKTSSGGIMGALATHPERLRAADKLGAQVASDKRKADDSKRWKLAERLNALRLDAWPRTSIFHDAIGANGKRESTELTPRLKSWETDDLAAYVEGFERSHRPRTPFEPGRKAAEDGARGHAEREGFGGGVPKLGPDGNPTPAQIEAAKSDPVVKRLFAAPNNTAPLEALAAQHVRTCAAHGIPLGGAS